jgi:hypothetical protein
VKTLDPRDLDSLTARDLDDLLHPEDARFPSGGDPIAFLGDES